MVRFVWESCGSALAPARVSTQPFRNGVRPYRRGAMGSPAFLLEALTRAQPPDLNPENISDFDLHQRLFKGEW